MNAHIVGALEGLESKLNSLLTSLTTSPTAAGAPAAAVALLEADDALSSALQTLCVHQANYAKILQLRAEAERLEERVKGIVREIEGVDKEITTVCGDEDDGGSDSCSDDEQSLDGSDNDMGEERKGTYSRHKEIDYRLLLEFARRISKYNKQAAADAASGARPIKKLQDGDEEMTGMNGNDENQDTKGEGTDDGAEPGEGVASITKDATQWLDDSADMERQAYMIPYPSEDRIRMGLMGQLQLAAPEGVDPEKEAEKLVREAEGQGAAGGSLSIDPRKTDFVADDHTRPTKHVSSARAEGSPVAVSRNTVAASKPRATIDLDLLDSDDDDV
jgi:vitamin-D-receptor interacting mediator subunit 4